MHTFYDGQLREDNGVGHCEFTASEVEVAFVLEERDVFS